MNHLCFNTSLLITGPDTGLLIDGLLTTNYYERRTNTGERLTKQTQYCHSMYKRNNILEY